jgi:hypothetical protein
MSLWNLGESPINHDFSSSSFPNRRTKMRLCYNTNIFISNNVALTYGNSAAKKTFSGGNSLPSAVPS